MTLAALYGMSMTYGDDDDFKEKLKEAMRELRDRETKAIFKEALKEWLDDQFLKFGRWSFFGLLTMAFGGIVWLYLSSQGWVHK